MAQAVVSDTDYTKAVKALEWLIAMGLLNADEAERAARNYAVKSPPILPVS